MENEIILYLLVYEFLSINWVLCQVQKSHGFVKHGQIFFYDASEFAGAGYSFEQDTKIVHFMWNGKLI